MNHCVVVSPHHRRLYSYFDPSYLSIDFDVVVVADNSLLLLLVMAYSQEEVSTLFQVRNIEIPMHRADQERIMPHAAMDISLRK